MTSYKSCAVPSCRSTTIKHPNKLFIHVPKCPKRRKQWIKLARRDPKITSDKSAIYFCEDHFVLEKDMENYMEYKIMGSVKMNRMKPDCKPSRFDCQSKRKYKSNSRKKEVKKKQRSAFNKRPRISIHKKIKETSEDAIKGIHKSLEHQLKEIVESWKDQAEGIRRSLEDKEEKMQETWENKAEGKIETWDKSIKEIEETWADKVIKIEENWEDQEEGIGRSWEDKEDEMEKTWDKKVERNIKTWENSIKGIEQTWADQVIKIEDTWEDKFYLKPLSCCNNQDAPAPQPEPETEPEIEPEPLTDQNSEVKREPESDYPDIPITNPEVEPLIKREDEDDDVKDEIETFEHNVEDEVKKGIKRRASTAFSDADGIEEFKGFDEIKFEMKTQEYSRILERLEAEVTAASKDLVPLRTVVATLSASSRASKRPRKDTDGSRPSSALSSRSDGDGATDASSTSSPAHRGGRRATTEMSSPLLRVPLERGWKRELVFRAALDAHSRRNADIYYYTPQGKKLRSTREVAEHLSGTGLTLENFSFFKEPLGVDDPEKEIIRDAKLIRRVESPVAASAAGGGAAEGKRTPKPKPPKGASPEPAPTTPAKSPPAKIKIKSMGSRLSNSGPPAASTPPANVKQEAKKKPQQQQQPATTTPSSVDNNNSAAWKKPSDDKRRGRVANGASSPPTATMSPRRRGRQRVDDTDYFTAFYHKAQENNYNVVVQIFQYLGMRDLAHCARVCKLWRQLASTPALWRHVRMKNSHVSDWRGLCAALKRHGTKRLDLRKMLLPQDDTIFWDQFAEHISTVDTLERIEMCRCPSRAVEALCGALPGLRALSALAIRDSTLDPAPLAALPQLCELRLKSMAGLSLTADLRHLAALTRLTHLSLTSIKELGWRAPDVIGQLGALESLELGECTFRAEMAGALGRLLRLRRLRLERGPPACAPAVLRALAALPLLTRLELVNVDVRAGFDDALAACRNVRRLLIIPTYVSQSATTNRQVLAGVLRLRDTLTHLMWGVTIELLRVTELFIDQCEAAGAAKRARGECIPVLKPVPGCRAPAGSSDGPDTGGSGPPQVEILPLPTLTRLLSQQLPHTRLKLLRIPFHATWRQSLADFQ